MPLTPFVMPHDLIIKSQAGQAVSLNRAQYPELEHVEGEPTVAEKNPAYDAALREAFAALIVARKRAEDGTRQRIFLGDAAVRLMYGRAKHPGERDCDVAGYVIASKEYGYWLAEGKGGNLPRAVEQFKAVQLLVERRAFNAADANDPRPGPVFGCLVATHRLHYLEWSKHRRSWIAYNGTAEDPVITGRVAAVAAAWALQPDKVYLLDGGREDRELPPMWAITPGPQPWRVYEHRRNGRDRGQFHPAAIGKSTLDLFFVA